MAQAALALEQPIDVDDSNYQVSVCDADHIHVEIELGTGQRAELIFADPDHAYAFARRLSRAYDVATGIAPATGAPIK